MDKWDTTKSTTFWAKRSFKTVCRDDRLLQKIDEQNECKQSRQNTQIALKREFVNKFHEQLSRAEQHRLPGPVISENLTFWIQHLSWTFCNNCKVLKMQRLLPNYVRRPQLTFSKDCICVKHIYINPSLVSTPDVLNGLSHVELLALWPFTVHLGDYVRKQNGYRQKTNLFRLSWSEKSVMDKIQDLESPECKEICMNAYEFLMGNSSSAYKKFVDLRDRTNNSSKRFNVYDFTSMLALNALSGQICIQHWSSVKQSLVANTIVQVRK